MVLRSALIALLLSAPVYAQTQQQQGPLSDAAALDRDGKTREARVLIQGVIDTTSEPAAKASAQRALAMSYAFDGDCANAVKYEDKAIAYWKTREQAEPQNAFYQEGEAANEGARVCIDAGDLKTAERYYRLGFALGNKEPAPRTHPAALWDFRLAHALGRLAARRGDKAEAKKQVSLARFALDSDTALAAQQERFYPYLTGYVALYTNDLQTAQADLTKALAIKGNERDPFMTYLLALTHDKMGHGAVARPLYQKAYDLATGHNPPSAFVRRNAPEKLK